MNDEKRKIRFHNNRTENKSHKYSPELRSGFDFFQTQIQYLKEAAEEGESGPGVVRVTRQSNSVQWFIVPRLSRSASQDDTQNSQYQLEGG